MKFKILIIASIIAILAMISCSQAGPIEVIYNGNTCDCPKNLNYYVQVPPTPPPYYDLKSAEYGYKLEAPVRAKDKITYNFDFTVLEPKTPPPSAQEPKLNLYAKIDRIMEHKKDCYTPTAEYIPNTSGYSNSAASGYISSQSGATYYTPTAESIPNASGYSNSAASGYILPKSGATYYAPTAESTPNTCGCSNSAASGYISSESSANRYTYTAESIPNTCGCGSNSASGYKSSDSSAIRYTPTAVSIPNTYGCSSCAASRYVSPESSATRFTRNSSKQPNSIRDPMEPSTTQIMAIFFEPLQQTETNFIKARNKRDISRIFKRPRKNEKRSERIVKQYNKRLTDQVSNAEIFKETSKPMRSRSISLPSSLAGTRPLHFQLKKFLNLPGRLRNRRDIKGEYDLIEKEREEMDLTLPEIIQYMPETLDPNFKRGPCQFGQICQNSKSPTDSTSTPASSKSETITPTSTSEVIKDEEINSNDSNTQAMESNNAIGSMHNKRNAAVYGKSCPLVFSYNNPTPGPSYTYESLTNYQDIPRPFVLGNSVYGIDPVPQLYVGAPSNPYSPADLTKGPLVGATYAPSNLKTFTNAQLDQIIAEIINKHGNFIEATSHRGGALVDPILEQKKQNKSYFKQLFGGNLLTKSLDERQQPSLHANIPYYQATPLASY